MKKNKTQGSPGITLLGILIFPSIIAIADIWGTAYFYHYYAYGTWMEFPTGVSCLLILILDFVFFAVLFEEYMPDPK